METVAPFGEGHAPKGAAQFGRCLPHTTARRAQHRPRSMARWTYCLHPDGPAPRFGSSYLLLVRRCCRADVHFLASPEASVREASTNSMSAATLVRGVHPTTSPWRNAKHRTGGVEQPAQATRRADRHAHDSSNLLPRPRREPRQLRRGCRCTGRFCSRSRRLEALGTDPSSLRTPTGVTCRNVRGYNCDPFSPRLNADGVRGRVTSVGRPFLLWRLA